ncbi:DUF1501 domain-containing protein [Verrucomicrobiales bacterium]|nr:DUF1501 domain-containing protein [Verrucomicrobiales bacterium]
MVGGGFKGGIKYGKTDEGGENVVENAVKIQDFNATVAYAMGLPLDQPKQASVYGGSQRGTGSGSVCLDSLKQSKNSLISKNRQCKLPVFSYLFPMSAL